MRPLLYPISAKFPIGYVIARAAERVAWSEVKPDRDGVKRAKISVLFESFERHGNGLALAALERLTRKLADKERELQTLKSQNHTLEQRLDVPEKAVARVTQKPDRRTVRRFYVLQPP
jgi:hypothetical protein